jgi:acyl-coenzyme A synthetase/AMP-(fatty) acid ligase
MRQNPSQHDATLGDWLRKYANSPDWTLWGAHASASLNTLLTGSALGGRAADLAGRSVLVATDDQLAAAVALIELDGVARRLILCPPGVAPEHLPTIVANAGVDAIVSDRAAPEHEALGVDVRVLCRPEIHPSEDTPSRSYQTEWILLTSGTTGAPKAVVHSLASLTAAIKPRSNADSPIVWATFYDIRRYGGLQIFLRAVLGGASLVLSDAKEPVGQFLARLAAHGATHITGTPSHWRRVLWSPAAASIAPRYARMSGEVADQAIIDNLRAVYPQAKVGHAYASTEAGVGFHVDDEREGFPASFLGAQRDGVEIKVEDGSLRIRSAGTATRYLGEVRGAIPGEDGFVDTGDVIVVRDGRCYFAGRIGGIINVGGSKVHPEEVEAVINRHPDVRMSLVRPKKNPITGSVVVADVVLAAPPDGGGTDARKSEVKSEILRLCRESLTQYKIPVMISFVPSLPIAESGKLARHHA